MDRVERRTEQPDGRRKWDAQLFERICIGVMVIAFLVGGWVDYQQEKQADEIRRDAIDRVCTVEDILLDFIGEPPNLPRDADALRRLQDPDCTSLLKRAEDAK